jgi:oligoendopeptidase F
MNYRRIYDQIIDRANREQRSKKQGTYYESHHIILKSEGGSNKRNNLVLLTAKEHYIVHLLLFMENPTQARAYAFVRMSHRSSKRSSAKLYQEAKNFTAKISSERNRLTVRTAEQNLQVSITLLKRNETPTEAMIRSRRELAEKTSKPVLQLTPTGKFLTEYTSARQAKLQTGFTTIVSCLKGRQKTSGGFIWKYA